jgi:hypothetical protein
VQLVGLDGLFSNQFRQALEALMEKDFLGNDGANTFEK